MSASTTPPAWNIASVSDATAPGCDLVRQWLRESNWAANPEFMEKIHQPEHATKPLVLLASEGGRVVSGLFAETQLAWLRISIMAVHPEVRSKGLGSTLLAEAERQAVARGCQYAHVDTMEHQAPKFYLARGYTVVGEIPDWDSHRHAKFHFTKDLVEPSPSSRSDAIMATTL